TPIQRQSSALGLTVRNTNIAFLRYTKTHDRKYYQHTISHLKTLKKQLKKLKKSIKKAALPSLEREISELKDNIKIYKSDIEANHSAAQNNNPKQTQKTFTATFESYGTLESNTESIANAAKQSITTELKLTKATTKRYSLIVSIVGIIAIITAIVVGYLIK